MNDAEDTERAEDAEVGSGTGAAGGITEAAD